MTAINVFRQSDAVHIISDGAFYDAAGVLCAIGSKVWTLPELPAAFALRGPSGLLPRLMERIHGAYRSFDDMLCNIALKIELTRAAGYNLPKGVSPEFDMFIVGWSHERNRPESYIYNSERCELEEADPYAGAPGVAGFFDSQGIAAIDDVKPVEHGLALLEAQRRLLLPNASWDGQSIYGVGGFAEWTRLDANLVTRAVIRGWPDVVGEKIRPDLPIAA